MNRGKILEELIEYYGYTIRGFAKECGLAPSTLRSILKNVGGASVDKIVAICKALHITVEELNSMANGEKYDGKTFEELQRLIAKERNTLTIEEKNKLIKALLEEDNVTKKAKDA